MRTADLSAGVSLLRRCGRCTNASRVTSGTSLCFKGEQRESLVSFQEDRTDVVMTHQVDNNKLTNNDTPRPDQLVGLANEQYIVVG